MPRRLTKRSNSQLAEDAHGFGQRRSILTAARQLSFVDAHEQRNLLRAQDGMPVAAFVDWPSAPLTKSLVLRALEQALPHTLVDSTSQSLDQPFVQWASYDSIDHERTLKNPSSTLSSSYTIRKALIRKHFLHRSIITYTTKYVDSPLLSCVPRTWDIDVSFADELDDSGSLWADELYELALEFQQNPGKVWILKPGMADRGMGIRLFNDKASLQRIFEEFEEQSDSEEEDDNNTNVVTSQLRHFVIQEYLESPVLLDPTEDIGKIRVGGRKTSLEGRKFHLRAYCVASGALKVFLYRNMLALFSSVPYSPISHDTDASAIDLQPHLTNTCLQGDSKDDSVLLLRELVGRTLLGTVSEDPGNLSFTQKDLDAILEQMSVALAETFKAALQMPVHFQPLPNAFELYGVDFLVCYRENSTVGNSRFAVKLLEVNAEPAIEMTRERLRWILEDLFETIGRVCVRPFFSAENPERSSIVRGREEEEHGLLRKCLDIPLRR